MRVCLLLRLGPARMWTMWVLWTIVMGVTLRDQFIEGVRDTTLRRDLCKLVREKPQSTLFDVHEEAMMWVVEGRPRGSNVSRNRNIFHLDYTSHNALSSSLPSVPNLPHLSSISSSAPIPKPPCHEAHFGLSEQPERAEWNLQKGALGGIITAPLNAPLTCSGWHEDDPSEVEHTWLPLNLLALSGYSNRFY
ncbi:uncharacterized protein LOC127448373 isoform X2 [Myxocyprinus asiaticus]|uniref:uncharacterized protein LOC127448373 isoform X2 n=1 Tax=Myxocyprinus asiaticus TaxID=70543 RepID=UPI002222E136|nr:uncharacterized protein LOC127448373 isoform X2 [Myxocyprinus asiaticus]